MKNPYHQTSEKPHHLDRAFARTICFDILNIFPASRDLAGAFEMAEEEEDTRRSLSFKLHHELAEARLSQLLLQIAVFVRTFDDVFSNGQHAAEYAKHANNTSGSNFIGTLNEKGEFELREACNKIIHATDFRPIYDYTSRTTPKGREQRAWHLMGEIELAGSFGRKKWEAVLYVENFLEIVLSRIAYNPSAAGKRRRV